jgi:hypothetical protein
MHFSRLFTGMYLVSLPLPQRASGARPPRKRKGTCASPLSPFTGKGAGG